MSGRGLQARATQAPADVKTRAKGPRYPGPRLMSGRGLKPALQGPRYPCSRRMSGRGLKPALLRSATDVRSRAKARATQVRD